MVFKLKINNKYLIMKKWLTNKVQYINYKYLKRCSCGKRATWVYTPANTFFNDMFCDKCIPRGCNCNYEYVNENMIALNMLGDIYDGNLNLPNPDMKFVWIDHGRIWEYLDENGGRYPCCEYWRVTK